MYILYAATGFALFISLIANRHQTAKAIRIAAKRFVNILPAFLVMLILISVTVYLIPDKVISDYLVNSSRFFGVAFASVIGSITLMPGFVAFPLAGILLTKEVPYMVLAAFTTSLMMVGVLTYPVEREYFGAKVTILRNGISLAITLIIALTIGIFFGEIF
ncbi:hypothetical protein ES703_43800 [subsurface metagenome]